MIPKFKPNYDYTDWLALLKIFDSNLENYEKSFANKFHNKNGIMFSYGRTALYALFKVWELENSEILCPAYTCAVVPHSIVLSGNIPVFVDSADDSFNMSLEKLENCITEKTRAVILTHLFGCPMDVESAQKIIANAEKKFGNKIYIIQDVAQSFGAKWNGRLITEYGDAAIFGCNIAKIINSVFGGMVITQNDKTADLLNKLRNKICKKHKILRAIKNITYFIAFNIIFNEKIYELINLLERKGFLNYFTKYFDENKIDFPKDWNAWPSSVEICIGANQLRKYEKIVEIRKNNVIKLYKTLRDRRDISVFPYSEGATYSYFTALVHNRQDWLNIFNKNKIQLGIFIEYCIPNLKAYAKYKKEEYPNANKYSQQTINFPIWEVNLSSKIEKILQKIEFPQYH